MYHGCGLLRLDRPNLQVCDTARDSLGIKWGGGGAFVEAQYPFFGCLKGKPNGNLFGVPSKKLTKPNGYTYIKTPRPGVGFLDSASGLPLEVVPTAPGP